VLIVCGLYAVLWGKSKEIKKNNQLVPSQSSNEFDTVEIVVRHVVDDKRNHNSNNGHGNTSQEVKDDQDSLEADQHENQSEYVQNQEKGGVARKNKVNYVNDVK